MGIAKVSIAFHEAGFKVVDKQDGNFEAKYEDITYTYSLEEGEIYYERLYKDEVDLVGSGEDELLDAIADEVLERFADQ